MKIFRVDVISLLFHIRQMILFWALTENAFGNITFATDRNILDQKL